MECEAQDGLHGWEDHFIFEIIDPDTGRFSEGQSGELVIGTLTKQALPMIRYRTRYHAPHARALRLRPRARAPRAHHRAQRRHADHRGVNVYPSQIEAVLIGLPDIAPHYQLVVERRGSLDELTIEVESHDPGAAERVRHHVKSMIGVRRRGQGHEARRVPRSQGKAVRVRDLRPKELAMQTPVRQVTGACTRSTWQRALCSRLEATLAAGKSDPVLMRCRSRAGEIERHFGRGDGALPALPPAAKATWPSSCRARRHPRRRGALHHRGEGKPGRRQLKPLGLEVAERLASHAQKEEMSCRALDQLLDEEPTMSSPALTLHSSRGRSPRDLDRVVWIDASLRAARAQAYFERRLAAAARDPERHLQLGVETDGRLAGYMLGRALEGEFGRTEPEVRLEAFGVVGAAQGQGLGAALLKAFEDEAARRGLRQVRTTALWREHALLASSTAPASGSRRCTSSTARSTKPSSARRARRPWSGARPADPNDYGTPRLADFAPLARDAVEIAVLSQADLEGVARIDRRHTGRTAAVICAAPSPRRSPIRRCACRSRRASTTRSPAMSWLAWTTATSAAPSPSR